MSASSGLHLMIVSDHMSTQAMKTRDNVTDLIQISAERRAAMFKRQSNKKNTDGLFTFTADNNRITNAKRKVQCRKMMLTITITAKQIMSLDTQI